MCKSWLTKPKVKGSCTCDESNTKSTTTRLTSSQFAHFVYFTLVDNYCRNISYLKLLSNNPKNPKHNFLAPKLLIDVNREAHI